MNPDLGEKSLLLVDPTYIKSPLRMPISVPDLAKPRTNVEPEQQNLEITRKPLTARSIVNTDEA